ncbi:hypothetical protein Daus18300_013713 [Diaporthe australafricana]|uniref:FluG domain-containing protein n=1 Tax=Diaporthe australafricana TaxID=127596 RepID=A0ABR3VXY6_9PEZI
MDHLGTVPEASAGSGLGVPALTIQDKIKEAEKQDDCDDGSVTKRYHRLRAEDLPCFIKKLEGNQKEKLKVDAGRIKRCRTKFQQSDGRLLLDVEKSFKQWRSEAGLRRDTLLKFTPANRDGHCKEPNSFEDGIDAHEDAIKDAGPEHDFKAGFLFFQKRRTGWRKATCHGHGFDEFEKFPNQKITVHKALFDKQHNPISMTKDENGTGI